MNEIINNKEIYSKFNDSLKMYFTTMLSWIDFFEKEHLGIPCKKGEEVISELCLEADDDILSVSSLIALLTVDSDFNELFNKYDISLDRITKFCNGKKPDKVNDITETEKFDSFDLSKLINSVIDRLATRYTIDDNVDLELLEPYQVFDYILMTNKQTMLETILHMSTPLLASGVIAEYNDLRIILDKEFEACFGIDDISDFENLKIFGIGEFEITYDNGEVFLSYDSSESYREIKDVNTNKKHKIFPISKVYKINNQVINREVFDEFCDKFDSIENITLTIANEYTGMLETITVAKSELLGNNNSKISLGNDITNQKFIKNPALGREKELDEIETVLLYPERDRSIIITGPGGTGKSSLVRGICYRIQNNLINSKLKNIKIVNVDITDCVAGSRYSGVLEEKMKSILDKAKNDKNTILLIEEIHRAMGAGKTEGDDNSVAQILKQYLDFGDVRIIGTTTDEEYAELIEVDTAFKSRFEKISIKEPEENVLYSIIYDLIMCYNKLPDTPSLDLDEDKMKNLINGLITGTRKNCRHYMDRENNPRLLINIVKRAYAIAAFDNSDTVTIEHVIKAYKSNSRLYESAREFNAKKIIEGINNTQTNNDGLVLQFKKRK